ncbi:MAG: hydrolase [Candidatus Nitrosocaldaceae archaeon]|nr:MAG: hydrolase [Candidatus Nitrosocaldaceae archaeon]GIU72631.1 MAG: hydrolase [Candidatus Nitrosocaldaceae archaeon]
MRVAVAQVRSSTDKEENLKLALEYIEEASKKNAELIAFPEFLMAYSPNSQTVEELYSLAESIDGEFVSSLVEASKRYKIAVIATIYEKSNLKPRVYDTAVFIKDKVISVYRKLHLYDALGFKESEKLIAGDKLPELIKVNEEKIGMMICYDLRFPELARMIVLNGANVLIVPSAWVAGDKKVEHWQVMLRARAIENGCYIVAPDQVGNIYIGRSMIIDPFGDIILDMGDEEGLGIADLDINYLNDIREKLPLLRNRRVDIYSINVK